MTGIILADNARIDTQGRAAYRRNVSYAILKSTYIDRVQQQCWRVAKFMSHQGASERWTGEKTIPVPHGKIRDFITGQLYDDSKHERNLQELAERLTKEYDYELSQLDRKFPIQMGQKYYYADIVGFVRGATPEKETVYLAVEIEPDDTSPSDPRHGTNQVISYMQMLPNCKYGIWYNGLQQLCYYRPDPSQGPVEISVIPPYGLEIEDIERPDFDQLRSAFELRSVFKRCHNHIAGQQGLRKEEAFHELLKLIFCKVLDERLSTHIQFYATNTERESKPAKCVSRIETLFERVKATQKDIFDREEVIKLDPIVLAYAVSQLQRYALLSTDTDVKGAAYEEIVGGNLRGDRGEFFTPRNVCRAAIEMLFHTFRRSKWDDLMMVDPACGTGGFLIAAINYLKREFFEMELDKWKDADEAWSRAEDRIKIFCERNMHGMDINPTLARACQMNEVMHGNGHGNVFQANSLKLPSEWKQAAEPHIGLGEFSLLFTNPPFGTKIAVTDSSILKNYRLGHVWQKRGRGWSPTPKLRKSAPPEQLFIERSVHLLKPGCRLGMIMADHILTNPGYGFIRQWIFENTRVIARIDLPSETFQPFVGTNAHLVLLERKRENEIGFGSVEYPSFGAIAKTIGHDLRGKPVYLRTPEGNEVIREIEKDVVRIVKGKRIKERLTVAERIVNDDLPAIVWAFKKWWDKNGW